MFRLQNGIIFERYFCYSLFSDGHLINMMMMTIRSEEHTSELQSQSNLVCRLLLEKKKNTSTRERDVEVFGCAIDTAQPQLVSLDRIADLEEDVIIILWGGVLRGESSECAILPPDI